MPTVDEIVAKYIELRDREAQIAERHKEELKPYQEGKAAIEKWLLDKMNSEGVDSYKTPHGTPYKNTTRSVKAQDMQAFKDFVFEPAFRAATAAYGEEEYRILKALVLDGIRWDMVDFRAGKKGIVEHFETTGEIPPGVSFDQFTTVNIRRS